MLWIYQKVSCKHGHVIDRNTFQDWLGAANPKWEQFVEDLERTGRKLRTNPDGDVEIPGAAYDEFVVPDCPTCMLEGRSNNVVRSTSRLFFLHKGLLFWGCVKSVGRSDVR